MRAAILSLMLCLSACADFPSLDDRIDGAARDAPYPRLTNIDALLAQANTAGPLATNATVAQDVAGRIANLNARAAALRGPIIENVTRDRMRRGIARSALR